MSRSVTGINDPREGEWPEDAEWCHEKGLLRESCAHCQEADIDRTTQEASFEALTAAFAQVLDRVSGGSR